MLESGLKFVIRRHLMGDRMRITPAESGIQVTFTTGTVAGLTETLTGAEFREFLDVVIELKEGSEIAQSKGGIPS